MIERPEGATLPDLSHAVTDANGGLYDFSGGWSFAIEIKNKSTLLNKTSGINGYRTNPNVVIAIAATGDIASLSPGFYSYKLTPTHTASGKTAVYTDILYIRPV